jgi:hypothetical protein
MRTFFGDTKKSPDAAVEVAFSALVVIAGILTLAVFIKFGIYLYNL